MASNNVNQTEENSRSSTDVNSALTQNQDLKAFENAKEHMQLFDLVVLNLFKQLKPNGQNCNEIAEILRKTLADYNSKRLEFLELQSRVLDVQIRSRTGHCKKDGYDLQPGGNDNEIIKLKSEYLLKQYKTLAQKTAERKDKIEHIRTIFKKVDQTAADESLATAASSYVLKK
ncbi:hypothetical protein TYRP_005687 [Tyrophagus putrescentiae]|nr:hypothetical protein TYRP_005687 [Tyrophagus putrescentiae]